MQLEAGTIYGALRLLLMRSNLIWGDNMRLLHVTLAILAALSLTVACTDANHQRGQLTDDHYGLSSLSLPSIMIIDTQSRPVAQAQVLIGSAPEKPFKGNVLTTDQNGRIEIPQAWTQPLDVTISGPGVIATTFLQVKPSDQSLQINIAPEAKRLEIKGEATEFGRLRRDGKVDFALVIPALQRRDILGFDIGKIMSPEVDEIKVASKRFEVPSNLTLPDQRESYILPIRFNKPDYRMYVPHSGFYRMAATHGQFDLEDVIDDIRRGKSLYDVINYFEFIGAGHLNIDITGDVNKQDIPVNQVSFDSSARVQAPSYSSNHVMVSLTMVDEQGFLYPADVKKVDSGKNQALKYPSANKDDVYFLSALTPDTQPALGEDEEEDTFSFRQLKHKRNLQLSQLSIVLHRINQPTPNFIPLLAEPIIQDNQMTLFPPAIPKDVEALGTYLVLYEVENVKAGNFDTEKKTRVWDIYSAQWLDELTLPEVSFSPQAGKNYRWEVLYLGRDMLTSNRSLMQLGDHLNEITHVSRTSKDI